jgi:hypothetical protein
MHRIVARMGDVRIARIEIRRAGRQWHPHGKRAVLLRMYSPTRDIRTDWEGWLIAGAFRDRSAVGHLPGVVALESWRRGSESSGERIAVGGANRPHPRRADAATATRLRKRVLAIARRSGAQVRELTVVRPYGAGFALVLRVAHPAGYLRYRAPKLLRSLADRWTRYEGGYFRVVDRAGRFVWSTGGSSRLGTGGGRIRPDLEGCNPTPPISYPIGQKIPRCPA